MKRTSFCSFSAQLAFLLLIAPALLGCGGCVSRYYAGGSTTTFGSGTTVPSGSSSSSSSTEIASADGNQDKIEAKVEVDSRDWVFWRGPEYTGVSRETGLVDRLDFEEGDESNLVWRRDDLGGRSTPVTFGGHLYTIVRDRPGTAEEGEKVVCVDLKTGKTIWENRFNVWLSDVPDTRVGWSSVVVDPETGNLYAHGVCGYFQCIDGKSGETIWANPMHEKFGFLSTYGGRTNFPVVVDDLVIVSAVVIGWGDMAKPAHRFVAFNKTNGDVVWYEGTTVLPFDTTYSSPSVTVVDGQKAIVFGSSDGAIWALQARTGKPIWQYRFSRRGLNVSPLVIGDTVFSGHSEENVTGTAMGSIVAINALAGTGDITEKESAEKWKVEELMMGKSSPIAVDGVLYCFDDRGKLYMLHTETGEEVARRHSVGGTMLRSSPLYADGKIYALSTSAWQVLQPDKKSGVKVVSKGRLPAGEEALASPICSYGRVFVQTTGALYCLQAKDGMAGIDKRPAAPIEAPIEEDEKPAHVQIIPTELLSQPGRITTFSARVFNSRGQLLDAAPDVEWSLDGPGQIVEDGTFLPDGNHVATVVKAKVGDLEGTARVRTVPSLPWEFDFDDLDDLPITWVGARYRHVLREVDGSKVAVKVTTIPKGTRSRCWFGHPTLHDYTIQADIKGAKTNNKMPDIGLICQGYTLDLQGANQNLELRTWVPHDHRTKEVVNFEWDAEKWYTMKFQATNEDGKTVLRGKVWPRGDDEPKEWTVTAVDSTPNITGSPGLFGNAKDAEIYLDNIKVTKNE